MRKHGGAALAIAGAAVVLAGIGGWALRSAGAAGGHAVAARRRPATVATVPARGAVRAGVEVRALPSPAPAGSAEPCLAVAGDGAVWMSWIEPRPRGGHALRVARLVGARWSMARTVVESESLVVNGADYPHLAALGGDRVAVAWGWSLDPATEASEVRLAFSGDGGASWSWPRTVHDDHTRTEHGFVSMAPAAHGVSIVWLDGRKAAKARHEGEAETTLRVATVRDDGTLASQSEVDGRTCDCCQTAALETPEGLLIAYRDRSRDEVRDIAVTRARPANARGLRWTEPATVHPDGWHIDGCPVNGPALAARGAVMAIAWFTAPGDSARVQVAFADDPAGARFGAPVRVDGGDATGRVGIAVVPGGALATWLERAGAGGAVRFRRVARNGAMGPLGTLAALRTLKGAGVPQAAAAGARVLFAWTEPGPSPRVRVAEGRAIPAP